MRFDVPFIPDSNFVQFILEHQEHIDSIHFSFYQNDIIDARHKLRLLNIEELIEHLKQIGTIRKFLLVNSRLHHPEGYFNRKELQTVLNKMAVLLDADVLDGIVYADQYFLQALSDTDSEVATHIEAVPSINFMFDSYDKVHSVMDVLSITHFKSPSRILLDRSLNRKPKQLQKLAEKCRQVYPELKLALLANEGCIYHCPFKQVHDGHIALANLGTHTDTYEINRSFGCMRYFRENPDRLFKSPFIRPEDLHRYEDTVDLIKLCGRTLGRDYLERTIQAYIDRQYEGNLLDLLDALDWMADEIFIANRQLPDNFAEVLSDCAKDCRECAYCYELLNQHTYRLGVQFKDLR